MYDSNRHKNLNSTSPITRQEEDTETVNHHFWNCTHVRHPPDEQLRHSDISYSGNYWYWQSVPIGTFAATIHGLSGSTL